MNGFNKWLKAQSPAVQSFIYAVETGVATAFVIFLGSFYSALTSPSGLGSFDWHGQLYTLEMGVAAAVVKAVLDFIKGNSPTQTPQGGGN